jgi:hypothetical protein
LTSNDTNFPLASSYHHHFLSYYTMRARINEQK